jgi:hypothetical protein
VSANEITFSHCDFSFSVVERSYFRNATFKNCKFVGAKFFDSNFRSGTFSNCDFDYATVQRCNIPVSQVLRNLPTFPNVRREFLQQLRANAIAMGDASHINQLISKELEAERDYWRQARKQSSEYYERKYGSLGGTIEAYWNSLVLGTDRWVWGHGESIRHLVIATLTVLLLLAVARWIVTSAGPLEDLRVGDFLDALKLTWALYLDLPVSERSLLGHGLWGSLVLLTRYLSIGLFISVVFRKLSKR